jgi:translocation and assembly module TamB
MSPQSTTVRVLRPLIAVAATIVFVALITVAAALVYVTTDKGEQLVGKLAKDAVSAAGLGDLTIDGLEIAFPPSFGATRLTIDDDGRRWLEIHELRLRPALAALAAGNLRFDLLAADSLELQRLPELPPSPDDDEPSWPRAVVVDELSIDAVMASGDLVGLPSEQVGPFRIGAAGLYRLQSGGFRIDGRAAFPLIEGLTAAGQHWQAGPGVLEIDVAGRADGAKGGAALSIERIALGESVLADTHLNAQIGPAANSGSTIDVQGDARPVSVPEAVAFLFGPRVSLVAHAEVGDGGFAFRSASADADAGAGVAFHIDARAEAESTDLIVGSLTVDGHDLSWPEPKAGVIELLGDRFSFASDFSVQADHGVALPELALEFGPLTAGGEAGLSFDDDSLSAMVAGRFDELSILSPLVGRDTDGAVDFEIVASGSTDALVLEVTAATTSLSIENTALRAADAAVDVTGLPAGPVVARVSVELDGTVAGDDAGLSLDARVETGDDGDIQIVAALRDLAGGSLDVSGRVFGDGGIPHGRVLADVAGLEGIGRLFGMELSGGVEADLASDENGISGSADVRALRLAGGVEVKTLSLRSSTSSGEELVAKATGVILGATELDMASLALRRNGDRYAAHLVLHDVEGAVDVAADVEAGYVDGGSQATLLKLVGTAGGRALSLVQPFVLKRQADGRTAVTGEMAIGQGHLSVDWTVLSDRAFGRVHAEEFPLRYITPFIDHTIWLDGSVTADLVVDEAGGDDGEEPIFTVAVRGMRAADASGLNTFAGFDMDANLRQRVAELVFSVVLDDGTGERLELSGTIERNKAPRLLDGVTVDSAVQATLEGGLGRAAIAELAVLFDARFSGRLSAGLRINGTVGDPTLQGLLELADGHYEDAASGAVLENITLRIDAANTDSAVITIAGDDGESGRLSGQGKVDLSNGIFDPRAEATLELERVRAARLDEVSAHISGALELYAAADAVRLSGNVRTDELSVTIPKRLPPEIIELNVVEENSDLLARSRGEAAGPSAPGAIADLDVTVEVPGPAFVRAGDANTEWRGRIEVGGTTAAITLGGGLDLVRGDFTSLGLRVVASEGKLRFDPSPDARHTIDLRGHIRRGGVDVTVIIAGAFSDLSVRLESNPRMPQDEILAVVLFGSDVSSLSSVQAVQLAAAVASLANPSTAADPLAWFRNRTRLDRVDIVERESDDDAQYMLSAGKYVRDGVFVSVDQPLGQGASEVALELEVTERLRLKSSVGADSTGSVGAAWTLDY